MNERSRGVLNRLFERGEEVFTQLSNELMMNPRFIQAMQSALKGKETVEFAVTQAMKSMNVPTRTEFKRATARLETLENELRELRDELRRTRVQAARASAAARTATRPAKSKAAGDETPRAAAKKKPGTRRSTAGAKAAGGARKKASRKGAARTRVTVSTDGTPVVVAGETPNE